MLGPRANPVLPNIWLGDIYDAHNRAFIRDKKINVVVNCTRDLPFARIPGILKYRVPVHDNLDPKEIKSMGAMMPNILKVIRTHHLRGDRILVHCAAGVQRSAIVVLSYLYKYHIHDPLTAYRYLKKRRSIVFWPSMNFRQSFLSNYGHQLSTRLPK